VITIESTIPPDMTIAQWHELLASRQPAKRRRRVLGRGRRGEVVALRSTVAEQADPCDHLHETTTHYDHERKLLTFLSVCRTCGNERVVEALPYEPRYEPTQPQRSAA
jgi:hypothetical protein